MIRPDQQMLNHIAILQSDPHFAPLRELLRKSLQDVQSRIIYAQASTEIRELQGRAKELSEILDHCDNAHDHIKAIKTAKQISPEHLT